MWSLNSCAVTPPCAGSPVAFCAGGKTRRHGKLDSWWEEALIGGGNATVRRCEHGGFFDGDVRLGKTTEGKQFNFLLSCGSHLRLCTPHAVTARKDLLCRFCCRAPALKKAKCQLPSQHERKALTILSALSPAAEWRWEVKRPWRHAPVDFFHAPTRVCFEVDGPHHFHSKMRGVPTNAQQQRDFDSCVAAWEAGAALVRLHHADLASGGARAAARTAIEQRRAGCSGSLLILSPSYIPVAAVRQGRVDDPWFFLSTLERKLLTARRHTDAHGCVLFLHMPS